MHWKEYYDSKLVSLDEAVKHVKSGDRITLGSACGTPEDLIDAMLKRSDELEDVELVAMVSTGKSAYARPEYEKAFRHNAFFVAPSTRKAVAEDRADYTPFFFGQFPYLMMDRDLPVDIAMVTVTPPDKAGNVSLGVSVFYDKGAALAADKVIAEVNPNMPVMLGDSFLHVTQIDVFAPSERGIVELPRPEIGDSERAIGAHIASLIKDRDCLQLGYGALPDAVLGFIADKKDLGIHSEMISDGTMDLVEKGVITCRKKNFHNSKIVICGAMGTKELYEWINYNTMIDAHPVEYINDPIIIGNNDNMVSINAGLAVDLLGQVAADMMGPNQYAAIGGQVDFVRGCRRSKGGRSIIALSATAAKGSVSRIVPALERGQAVTTSRQDVDYIITEHGIAHLYGKTVKDRARALIEIADPKFRDQLYRDFEDLYGRDCRSKTRRIK